MVHKRYRIRSGKQYGPYLYENVRVGDKIVTRYIGKADEEKQRNTIGSEYSFIFIAVGAVALLIFLVAFNLLSPTGRVTSSFESEYLIGEPFTGTLFLEVKQGELFPAASTVFLENGNTTLQLPLTDLVSVERVDGIYYLENFSLYGSGEGYGIAGEHRDTPELSFTLIIAHEDSSSNEESSEEVELLVEINETPLEEGNEEVTSTEETSAEPTTQDETELSSSPLTGSVILDESPQSITGYVRKGSPFTYTLAEGQHAQLLSGSVKLGEDTLDDSTITLEEHTGEVTVSTEYGQIQQGFGKEYIGDSFEVFALNLSRFNLTLEESELNIRIVYDIDTLVEFKRDLRVASIEVPENESALEEPYVAPNITFEGIIPTLFTSVNTPVSLTLSTYFTGAVNYEVFASENLSVSNEGDILTFMPSENYSGSELVYIRAHAESGSVESNVFSIIVSQGTVEIVKTHTPIVIGEKVYWTANVTLEVAEPVMVQLPSQAEDVVVLNMQEEQVVDSYASPLTGSVSAVDQLAEDGISSVLHDVFGSLTGLVVDNSFETSIEEPLGVLLSQNATEYVIEYNTEAPTVTERNVSSGKEVFISGPDGLNYTDVFSYTMIPELFEKGEEKYLKVYWNEEQTFIPFNASDTDGDHLLDYIAWITPHLSNQTFSIIYINRAEHLDENKTFVEDMFDYVRYQDSYFKEIPSDHHVRVGFEHELGAGRDISIVARSDSVNASVQVYMYNSSELLADFGSISDYKKYQIFLSALGNRTSDLFDLHVTGGSVFFDYIVDPLPAPNLDFTAPTPANGSILFAPTNTTIYINVSSNDSEDHYTFVEFNRDVLLWMRMDNINGSTGVFDNSSYGHLGIAFGGANRSDTQKFGKSFFFDGADDYLQINGSIFQITTGTINTSFSVSLWVNATGFDNVDELVGNGPSPTVEPYWYFALAGGTPFVHFNNGSTSQYYNSTLRIRNNTWAHLTFVYNQTTVCLYVNASSDGCRPMNLSGPIHNTTVPYRIGRTFYTAGPSSPFNGTIDEVIIFNRTLTSQEIGALYNASQNQYFRNFSLVFENAHNFTAYAIDTDGNINSSRRTIFVENIGLLNCTTLDLAGTTYYLTKPASSPTNCFTISADNITLDAQGYLALGDGGATDNAVLATGKRNISIKNLVSNQFGIAIAVTGTNNSYFSNINITNAGGSAAIDVTSSFNNTFENITIFNSATGIRFITRSNNNILRNFTFMYLTSRGISFQSTSNNTIIERGVISNVSINGIIFASGSSFNQLSSVLFSNSTSHAIRYNDATNVYNNFTNISFAYTAPSSFDIFYAAAGSNYSTYMDMPATNNYSFTGLGSLVTFKNTQFGEIKFIDPINGSGTNLSQDIVLRSNSVYVNSSLHFNGGLNKSANVSLYGISTALIGAQLYRDDVFPCNTTSVPSCYNFTSLVAGNVFFNVSSWSNYSITGSGVTDITPPNIAFVNPTPGNGSTQRSRGIYVNISSNDSYLHYTFVDFDFSTLLWLRMDEVNGSSDPYDLTRYMNNASARNGAVQNTSGRFGKSFSFDGTDDYLTIPDSPSIRGKNISISAWFYLANTPLSAQTIISKPFDGPPWSSPFLSWMIRVNSITQMEYDVGNGGSYSGFGVTVPALRNNTWYHVALTYNGTELQAYFNGTFVGRSTTVSGPIEYGSPPVLIGADYGGDPAADYFNGSIDEVIIFNRTLTSNEIGALYNATATQISLNFTGLGEGAHIFTGYTVDSSANRNQTEQRTVSVDSTPPLVTISYPLNTTYEFSLLTFNVSLNENGSFVNFTLTNGLGNNSMSTTNNVNFSYVHPGPLNGQFTMRVFARDQAGNVNNSVTTTFNLDYSAPGITIGLPQETVYNTTLRNLTFAFTLSEGGFCNYSLSRGLVNYTMNNFSANTFYNATNTSIADGAYNVTAYCVDFYNHFNTAVQTFYVDTRTPTPTFVSPTPANGSIQAGNSLFVNISVNETNPHYALNDLDRSLLLWYTMDNINGSGGPTDLSTYSHNASNLSGAFQNGTYGKFGGKSYQFDGTDDRLSVEETGALNILDDLTISIWAYDTRGFFSNTKLVSKYNAGPVPFRFYLDTTVNQRLRFFRSNSTSTLVDYTSPVDFNSFSWQHLVVVINTTGLTQTLTFYVNNTVAGTTTYYGRAEGSSQAVEIAGEEVDFDYFAGYLDDVVIFNRSLSPAEVGSLYSAGANKFAVNYTSLRGATHTIRGHTLDIAGYRNQTELRTITLSSLTSCGTINFPGTYTLASNQIVNGTCFTITSDNVLLDGQGYSINGTGGSTGVVVIGRTNVTIKNLSIYHFTNGVVFNQTNSSRLLNVFSYLAETYGLYMRNSSSNVIANSTFTGEYVTSTSNALYLFDYSRDNIFINNNFSLFMTTAQLTDGINNTFENNFIGYTTQTNFGDLQISRESKLRLINNTIGYANGPNPSVGNLNLGISNDTLLVNNTIIGFAVFSGNNNTLVSGINSTSNPSGSLKIGLSDGLTFGGVLNVPNQPGNPALLLEANVTRLSFIDAYLSGTYNLYGSFLTVNQSQFGAVTFLQSVGAVGSNISQEVRLMNNSVSVNLSILEYNVSANITFVNVGGMSNPAIYRDGSLCPASVCQNLTALTASTVRFNVTGWGMANYSLVDVPAAPYTPVVRINSSLGTNRTLEDLFCSAVLSDQQADRMNVSVAWYNNSVLKLRVDYNNSYANGTLFIAQLDDGNTTRGHNWTCGLQYFDGISYTTWVNSTNLTILNTLPIVTLAFPTDFNITTNRTKELNWTGADDDIEDILSYQVNISAFPTGSDDNRWVNVSTNRYMITPGLKYFSEKGTYYMWSVRANDSATYGSWTGTRQLNLTSLISISLLNASIEFGQLAFLGSNDTTTDSPKPFLLQNDGNSLVNVTIDASSMWIASINPTSNYRYKAANFTFENNSFRWAGSITSFTNIPLTGSSSDLFLALFNYTDATDSAEIDIFVQVPANEPPNLRNSTVNFIATLTE